MKKPNIKKLKVDKNETREIQAMMRKASRIQISDNEKKRPKKN